MPAQIYRDIWVRWVHLTWENRGNWRPDISKKVLCNPTLKAALFIFDDHARLFIQMSELIKAIGHKPPRKNGVIVFKVDPEGRSVDGCPTDLQFIKSRTKRWLDNSMSINDFI